MAKKGFKDTLEDYRKLSSDIRSRVEFSPIYLLMGEETYFIDKLEQLIRDSVLSPEERDFNENIMYGGKDLGGDDVAAAALQMPVMAERMLVVVREAQQLVRQDEMVAYANKPSKTTVLVLCYKGKKVDGKTKLYKAIEKNGVIFESIPPRLYEMGGIVKSIASDHNLILDDKSESMMIQFVGPNLQNLNTELKKLADTMPEGRREVTDADIEQKVGVSREYNVFELTSALSECDFKKALQIVANFASNPKQSPTQIIFPTLYSHFQRIMMLGVLMWTASKKGLPVPSDLELTKKLGLQSSFFLREYKQALTRYNTKRTFAILGLIRSYDMQTKGVGYNSAEDHELLRELVIKIMSTK